MMSRTGATVDESGTVAAVEAARSELISLCERLVSARSVNPPGDTRDAADVVAAYFRQHGISAEVVAEEPTMPSVLASVTGAAGGPHLVLNVHLDTMPPGDESEWSVPVYELTREDGRLYGLGMGNMKGAVAAMALAFRLLHERRETWRGRLTFTAVSDECVFGDHGASYLLRDRRDDVVGDALICGEGPGFRRLALGEKGVAWYRIRATSAAGHASRAQAGATAVAALARTLSRVDLLNDVYATPPSELAGAVPPEDDEAFRLSANVGIVGGGSFISQMATVAEAQVDVRIPPGLTLAEVDARIRECAAGPGNVHVERLKGWEPNWSSSDEPFVASVISAAETIRGAHPTGTIRLPASDASRWRALGVPAVCLGPQPTLSAGVDDYAEFDDVVDCAKIYAVAAARYLTRT